MSQSSRKGRKIARRACDLCRDRRIQCAFDPGSTYSCRQCLKVDAPCTFLTNRKPRGPPPTRRVPESLNHPSLTGPGPSTPASPFPQPFIRHLVPEPIFHTILTDFFARIYPLVPLVHRPTFNHKLSLRAYETEPAFYRLCISLCAVTVASLPRNFASYAGTLYRDTGELFDRPSNLVWLSRAGSKPSWQNEPSVEQMVESVILGVAGFYCDRTGAGWRYAGDAVQCFREMGLYASGAYRGLDAVRAELCKRVFWFLLMVHVHDQMGFLIPQTGLCYDPNQTDWEFLLPLELSDEELTPTADGRGKPPDGDRPPMISGFVGLVKVFACVVDILGSLFPGAPRRYSLSSSTLAASTLSGEDAERSPAGLPGVPLLDHFSRLVARLHGVIGGLPDELRPMCTSRSPPDTGERASHFAIMRTNIHVTSLYIQAMVLEMCLNHLDDLPGKAGDQTTGMGHGPVASPGTDTGAGLLSGQIAAQLRRNKSAIAAELLNAVSSSLLWTLESNGQSIVGKIREVAATLLEQREGQDPLAVAHAGEPREEYLGRFAKILAELDYAHGAPWS